MKRKIYGRLLEWKEKDQGSCALLLDGARRVGKSYIARQFGEKEYRSYLMIDFAHMQREVREIFENDRNDLDLFFNKLSAYYRTTLYRRESLVIFDEVQRYPEAREGMWKTLSFRRRRNMWKCFPWILKNFYGQWETRRQYRI